MTEAESDSSPLKEERNEITVRYETLQKKHQELHSNIAMCAVKKVQVGGFQQILKKHKGIA